MSYVFKKIGATNILENAPAGANVVCEVNGEVNRVPATGFSGIKVAIIKQTGGTYSCDNMTYEKAVEYLTNGVPFLVFLFNGAEYMIAQSAYYDGTSKIGVRATDKTGNRIVCKWTSAGITDVTVS